MKMSVKFLTQSAVIAALYAALTHLQNVILPGSATWAIQMRMSEALCVLAFFTPAAIPGLSLGCLLFNLTFAYTLPLDFVVGTLATFLAALVMWKTRTVTIKGYPLLGMLMPAIANAFLVGWELTVYIGGGFVIIPLLRAKFVDEYGWIDDKETLDLVAIAQSMPGIVAVNAAIILGYRMGGIMGTLTALLATVLPPLITLSLIASCYTLVVDNYYVKALLKGMQCGATALIVDVALDLMKKQGKKKLLLPIAITIGTFIASFFFDVNVMYLILVDGIIGFLLLRDPKYN